MNLDILPVEVPETGLSHPLEATVGVVYLKKAGKDFGIEVEQPEEGGDRAAGKAAAAGQVTLRVGLPGVQQLAEAEGLLDRVGVPDYLQTARFSAFPADPHVGGIDPMSLKNRELIPYDAGFSERNVRATREKGIREFSRIPLFCCGLACGPR